jgi:hypothetical protein
LANDNPDAFDNDNFDDVRQIPDFDHGSHDPEARDSTREEANIIQRDDLASEYVKPEFWAPEEIIIAGKRPGSSDQDDFGRNLVVTHSRTIQPLDGAFKETFIIGKRVDLLALKTQMRTILKSQAKEEAPLSLHHIVDQLRANGEEASLPYHFICLLHLTNEHNLELFSSPQVLPDGLLSDHPDSAIKFDPSTVAVSVSKASF